MFKHLLIAGSMALVTSVGVSNVHAADLSEQDKHFVAAAASAGMLEVRLGEYASQNASSDDVKKFGEQMVDDHTKANEELKSIGEREPIEIPKEINDDDKAVLDRLEAMKGDEFDKAYVKQMVEDHKKVVEAFDKEASEGSDEAVKAFAVKTLPVLKHHLEMAQDLDKKING